MAMYAAAGAALCLSSSVAAFVMNKKDDETSEQPENTVEKKEIEGVGSPPPPPPAPPSEPEQKQLTTPYSMRSASSIYASDAMGVRAVGTNSVGHGLSMLDSPQAWSSGVSAKKDQWIQLDNGKVGTISGVITQGRKNFDQWVKTFKVKYKDETGTWWDVDGKTFNGNVDRNTKVTTTFSKPVVARYIRIYPQTWRGHQSMRVEMIAGETNTDKTPALGDLQYSAHSSSGNWGGDAIGTDHGAGRLDSERAWSALTAEQNAKTAWYQLSLNAPVNISGVAMKGRPDAAQWITSVVIQYEDENGEFKVVDDGFVFDANYDQNSLVKIFFENPIRTKTIRFNPRSWNSHMSGRFGILRGGEISSTETYQIMGYTSE
jgi:hypothetical protein